MRWGWFHPTANLDNVDPQCAKLDYIQGNIQDSQIQIEAIDSTQSKAVEFDIYNDSHIYAVTNAYNNNFHDVAGRPFTEDEDNIDYHI